MIQQDGKVAIKYYQTIPHVVGVSGVGYAFVVHANICLGWVNEEHANTVLSLTRQCCGGSRKHTYFYANESDVRRWTNRGGA